jgi:dTDP-4-dehydrorhamnose reductase
VLGPILVTGGSGQLATALVEGGSELPIRRVGRPEFDFDRPETLAAVFASVRPCLVVNAAAYTAVDAAETNEAVAMRANAEGPAALATLCRHAGAPLIHISTDYVFDGLKGAPYTEADATSPQCVYGETKLAGEQAVLTSGARAMVLRTSWVYAPIGRNFVRTMLSAAQRTPVLRVVADQKGCPTAAADLAQVILDLVCVIARDGWSEAFGGMYHVAARGWTTWHGLAEAIFRRASQHGLAAPEVTAIATADWPTAARRPPDSRLDCSKLAQQFGLALPQWEPSVARTVDRIFAAEASA